ncbi:MAG: hypothetical protein POELPBGB_01385 [Bacteroidia bacterium]|nr:hypothetical protein [Bacteroidia bacterium]
MVTAIDFNTLSLDDRGDMLWKRGKYFYEIVDYNKAIYKLYMLYGFIVEVDYPVEENYIKDIRAFAPYQLKQQA